tara:strand:+ start:5113 stop:5442 length:330 start_codon:yes stop_codon:yes gene_type:complete
LLRLEKHSGQILLIGCQYVEGEAARALNHAVAGAVGTNSHHHKGGIERSLSHPTSGEPVDLIPFCNTTDEQAMGNFSQEGFLGVEIERHHAFEADIQLRSQSSDRRTGP